MPRVFIQARQSWSAIQAPVIEAVRVPPSAWITSQSMVIWRSPSALRSTTERKLRPIRRWISTVRPFCLPVDASRRVRSSVARGSMPYSAVIQPRAWPLSQGGRRSSSVAVTKTWVSPKRTKHEPSAYFTTPRSSDTGRNSSGCRRLGRMVQPPWRRLTCRAGDYWPSVLGAGGRADKGTAAEHASNSEPEGGEGNDSDEHDPAKMPSARRPGVADGAKAKRDDAHCNDPVARGVGTEPRRGNEENRQTDARDRAPQPDQPDQSPHPFRFDAGTGKNSGLAQHPVQDGRGHGEYSSELHGEIAHLPTPYGNVWWRYHLDR